MITLGQLPCMWMAPDPAPATALYRMNRYLRDYFRVNPNDHDAMMRFLERETATHVLVMPVDVLPGSSLPLYAPDPLLLESGACFRMLSRNSVTAGFDNRHGPLICPRKTLLEGGDLPQPQAVLPVALSDWQCNDSDRGAFVAGFETITVLPAAEAEMAASIGSDAPHGHAWLLGALCALENPGDPSSAWAREQSVLADPSAAWHRITTLARVLRLSGVFELWPLDPAQSRLARAITGDVPPLRYFQDMADFCAGLGSAGEVLAARYRAIAQ